MAHLLKPCSPRVTKSCHLFPGVIFNGWEKVAAGLALELFFRLSMFAPHLGHLGQCEAGAAEALYVCRDGIGVCTTGPALSTLGHGVFGFLLVDSSQPWDMMTGSASLHFGV